MNANLLEMVGEYLTPSTISQMSKSFGMNDDTTKGVITSALPVLFSALAGNSQGGGAGALFNALSDSRHDGSILGQIGNLIGQPEAGEGMGILGHLLGDKRQTVEQSIGNAYGLNAATIGKVMMVLAPIVMGILGRQKRQSNMGVTDLSDLLVNSRDQFSKSAPQEMGMVGRLLDRDGDGSIKDDVAKIGMNLLSGFLRR